ncbi:MAG: sugar phosphate isomerase/epimerase family protein [Planctomycetota bacterium]
MKVALHTISYGGFWGQKVLSVEEIIGKAKAFGYDGIEIVAKRPHASPLEWTREKCLPVRDLLAKSGMTCFAVAGYTDFTNPGTEFRDKELLYLREAIRMTKDLGCKILRVFAGGMGALREGVNNRVAREKAIEQLKAAVPWAADAGITLALQNHPPVTNCPEDVLEIIEGVGSPVLQAVIDAPLFADVSEDTVVAGVKLLGKRIVHVHTSDYVLRPSNPYPVPGGSIRGFATRYVPLGEGCLPFAAYVKALHDVGFQGALAYEMCSFLPGGGSEANLDKIAKAALATTRKWIADAAKGGKKAKK